MIHTNWSVPSTVQEPRMRKPCFSRSGTICDRHSSSHWAISPGLTVYSRSCQVTASERAPHAAAHRLQAADTLFDRRMGAEEAGPRLLAQRVDDIEVGKGRLRGLRGNHLRSALQLPQS